MYLISNKLDLKDLLRLAEDNKKVFLRNLIYDENIPVSAIWAYFKSELENLLDRSIIRLALKNINRDVDCVVLVEKSDFDSRIFGLNVGKISLILINPNTARNHQAELTRFFDEIKDSAATLSLDVIFARIGLEQLTAIQHFENVGAVLTDVLLTFYCNIKNEFKPVRPLNSARVEKANRDDEEELIAISREAFKTDHFHGDSLLPKSKADKLYAKWVSNVIKQQNNQVLVARDGEEILGFVSCRVEKIPNIYRYGVIDLIAVKDEHRGKGLGSALVLGALEWFSGYTKSVYVGTQASNFSALRIYQKCGFKIVNSECDLHLWVKH